MVAEHYLQNIAVRIDDNDCYALIIGNPQPTTMHVPGMIAQIKSNLFYSRKLNT